MDTLVDSSAQPRDEARQRMSKEEFGQAEKKFDGIVPRIGTRVKLRHFAGKSASAPQASTPTLQPPSQLC